MCVGPGDLADHRIIRIDEAGRWEIFHDVLAGAVLGWKHRLAAERAVAEERAEGAAVTDGSPFSLSARSSPSPR